MARHIICVLTHHKFRNWEYISGDSCEQQRICQRDGYTEKRMVPHQFGEWEYLSDDSCLQMRVCTRDGFKEMREMPHQWGEYNYVWPNRCDQLRICKRCNAKEYLRGDIHTWRSATQQDKSSKSANRDLNLVEICQRCDIVKVERMADCHRCGGSGYEKEKSSIAYSDPSFAYDDYPPCFYCNGSGQEVVYDETFLPTAQQ